MGGSEAPARCAGASAVRTRDRWPRHCLSNAHRPRNLVTSLDVLLNDGHQLADETRPGHAGWVLPRTARTGVNADDTRVDYLPAEQIDPAHLARRRGSFVRAGEE